MAGIDAGRVTPVIGSHDGTGIAAQAPALRAYAVSRAIGRTACRVALEIGPEHVPVTACLAPVIDAGL